MKNLTFKTKLFSLALLTIIVAITYSCSADLPASGNDEPQIATLINRSEVIQNGKEWDDVQNNFSNFKANISNNPDDAQSKIQMAQLYIGEARVTGEHGHYYPAALSVLNSALDQKDISNDMKFLALTTKAGVQLSLHEFADALATGNEAALMNPSNAQIHGVLVDANVELGNYDKAIKLVDKMMMIKPDIRSYSRVSYLREIYGDVDGSIEAMILAVKSGYPGLEETAWAMLTLGNIYEQYGKLDMAMSVYEQILEMRPNYPFAVGAIGDIQASQGLYTEAEATYKKAINIIPEVGFYVSLANLYKTQKREDEMKDLIAEIMVMLKDDTDSGHNMNLEYASLYHEILEDQEKALEFAMIEYEKRPKNIDVNRMLAKIYTSKGEQDIAKEYLLVAKSTNSQHPELASI
ncbi:tetratricopeptide repeat protein [Portibacter lacus]|uniref:Tetratricopeptide repeat protein n=1 Tax=Portibacter lacus TaxID=1099794 RepID=A0AA37SMF1_9BACT|nr:tetratricopeptide repeat protein [Portibacter lacus]GLR15456.1 hypothetical protein GCM10007940_00710 [Portibacter lacus]